LYSTVIKWPGTASAVTPNQRENISMTIMNKYEKFPGKWDVLEKIPAQAEIF
jgi:hypothetical protein